MFCIKSQGQLYSSACLPFGDLSTIKEVVTWFVGDLLVLFSHDYLAYALIIAMLVATETSRSRSSHWLSIFYLA